MRGILYCISSGYQLEVNLEMNTDAILKENYDVVLLQRKKGHNNLKKNKKCIFDCVGCISNVAYIHILLHVVMNHGMYSAVK